MSLTTNKAKIQQLLDGINALPEASSGVELPTLTNEGAASDLLSGKQLIKSNGAAVTGTMPNNGTISKTIDGLNTKTATIPSGYTSGGTVTVDDTVDNIADNQATLLAQAISALESKASVGSDGEDVTAETTAYTNLLDDLEDAVNALPDAGGGSSGGVETCTVTITLGSAANLIAYATSYLDGVISAVVAPGTNTSVYVLENVVCGSMIFLSAIYYTSVPGYTLGNGVTGVNQSRGIFRAPTQAGVNGTIYIFDDM